MATQTVSPAVQFQQDVPRSFLEALNDGWRIAAETSRPAGGKRCGSVTLEKNGSRIAIGYFADRDGYRFDNPQAL